MTDNTNFLISILICCYNSEKFIDKTLSSIICQKYKNFEIIIVDDGSKDNTKNIINDKLKDYNFIYYYQKNKGLAAARNVGIQLSNSNYIFILDHDDVMSSNRIEKQLIEINNNRNFALYFGDIYVDYDQKITKYDYLKNKYNFDIRKLDFNINKKQLLKYGCFIASSSVVFNKKLISDYLYEGKFSYVSDFDFFMSIINKFNIYKSNNIYGIWNTHKKQVSVINKSNNYLELIKLYKKHFFNRKFYLFDIKIIKVYLFFFIKFIYYKILFK